MIKTLLLILMLLSIDWSLISISKSLRDINNAIHENKCVHSWEE